MRRWFIPTLTLCLLWTIGSLALAQTPSFTPSPHVYRMVIGGCAQPPLARTQTGFRVKDPALVGIVTALHGVAGCQTITAMPDGESTPLLDLTITQVDIARDVALLGSKQIDALPLDGLTPALETTAAYIRRTPDHRLSLWHCPASTPRSRHIARNYRSG